MTELPPYTRGIHPLGHGCYAWLEPPGGWGLANSGVIVGSDEAVVIDTQNDLRTVADLHTEVEQIAGDRPVTTVVNTHADGDHWNGNQLYRDARILATEATIAEMHAGTHYNEPSVAALADERTPFGRYLRWRARAFDFDGWEPVYPNQSFTGEQRISVDGRDIDLTEVGPAHTDGDTLVHVPDAGILFAGDILFIDSAPIVWAGPISRCIDACTEILRLEPAIVVPGHGPVVTAPGVAKARDYYSFILDYATREYRAGNTPRQAYTQIDLGAYAGWPHASRTYQNIYAVYKELEPQTYTAGRLETLQVILADDDGEWTRQDAEPASPDAVDAV
jgi:cyclase